MRSLLIIFLLTGISLSTFAISWRVKTFEEFLAAQKSARKEDSIVWLSGVYSNIQLEIEKNGIVFCAENAGSVTFTGESFFKLKADSVVFSGFQFRDGKTKDDVLEVSGNHNILENLNFSNYHSKYYLNVLSSAQYNLITRCNFEKKPEDVTSSVVEIQASPDHPGYNVLRWCSFKNHTAPPNAGGDYGIEALRIGYSYQSKFVSRTLIEYCYFTKCNGDGEIISSKARENVYRYNTFENNGESHVTLRHGKDNVVYGNFFVGGSGLRIKEGQNQMVYNNYFDTGDRFSIWLVNHNADPLDHIVIANNTFVSSGSLKLGGEGSFKPQNSVLINNLFVNPTVAPVSDLTGSEKFINNVVDSSEKYSLPEGFVPVKTDLFQNGNGLFQSGGERIMLSSPRTAAGNILDISNIDDDPQISLDIMQQRRTTPTDCVGCSINRTGKKLGFYAAEENTGPAYLHVK
jgi:hypothetical protein